MFQGSTCTLVDSFVQRPLGHHRKCSRQRESALHTNILFSTVNRNVRICADENVSVPLPARVLLTRESGKNEAVMKILEHKGIPFYELPMIETVEGPDQATLKELLGSESFSWVAITSPEAARVYIDAWNVAGSPSNRIAAVGAGTAEVLETSQLQCDFIPSKANAETLAAELPMTHLGERVLYPASSMAKRTLQDGLESRGFHVLRLNTYSTEKVTSIEDSKMQNALLCPVVAIASPSALRAWVDLVGIHIASQRMVACIGSTSGNAALELGLQEDKVLWHDNPGIQGLIISIETALEHHKSIYSV